LLLAHWQVLAGPDAPPFIDRRAVEPTPGADRRENEPERRAGSRDRRAGDDTRFIRVRADKLDKLIDLIGELVIASSGAQLVAQKEQSPSFIEASMRIHDLVQEARDGALGLRMVPIGETFARFHRVVRDVSKALGKEVELHISGGDTEMDKSMVETIADPLMHLVRNSLDHGIESSDDRVLAGKSPVGQLALHAYHESGSIVIEVSDDGKGLNRERILEKAVERGLISAGLELTDEEIYQLIFLPGFSTAEQVTNLSGRGVGMDVVKRNVETLRGQIKVASQPGRGATMQIRLPLTLAIIDGFLTNVGGVSYVLPLELVAECLEVPPEYASDPSKVSGHFDLRGEVVPYLDLGLFYRHQPPKTGRRSLILVRDGMNRVGLIVDRLLGEHQTVIKPLGQVFQQIRGLAGSTILGSGEVALILDVPALLDLAINRLGVRS
jgi:two-component system chemotaxis sensor kinase CheA